MKSGEHKEYLYKYIEKKMREMLRWNTFSHDYSTNKRLRIGKKKEKNETKRNKREREFVDENSCWLTCLFAKERIQPRCFLFFLAPPSTYTHTQRYIERLFAFYFVRACFSSFPLLFFLDIENVLYSWLFYKCEMFVRVVLSIFLSVHSLKHNVL